MRRAALPTGEEKVCGAQRRLFDPIPHGLPRLLRQLEAHGLLSLVLNNARPGDNMIAMGDVADPQTDHRAKRGRDFLRPVPNRPKPVPPDPRSGAPTGSLAHAPGRQLGGLEVGSPSTLAQAVDRNRRAGRRASARGAINPLPPSTGRPSRTRARQPVTGARSQDIPQQNGHQPARHLIPQKDPS